VVEGNASDKHPHCEWQFKFKAVGHSLNLAEQDALAVKVKGVKTALARAKKVVKDFNHSRLDSEQLEAEAVGSTSSLPYTRCCHTLELNT